MLLGLQLSCQHPLLEGSHTDHGIKKQIAVTRAVKTPIQMPSRNKVLLLCCLFPITVFDVFSD